MAKKDVADMSVEQKLKNLYQLQTMLSESDRIKILRGELPLEVQDLEDEIEGLTHRMGKYNEDVEACKALSFAVEAGSAGMAEVEKLGASFTEVKDQATALMEVAAGTSDAAVIDSLMAGAMVGEGTSYDSLTYTVSLNAEEGEQYGVGFRQGSDLADALNDFFAAAYADGSMQACAETYGIQAALIAQ